MLLGINILAVLLSAVASMAIGYIWYSESLYGKQWMELAGFKKEELNPSPLNYVYTFILAIVSTIALNIIVNISGWNTIAGAFIISLVAGVGLVATSLGTVFLYERKPRKLFFIDAGYQIVWLAAAGIIVGIFV